MNERLTPKELTGANASSKLDISHSNSSGRFAMDTIIKDRPSPADRETGITPFRISSENPINLEGLIASRVPQAQREAASAAWDVWASSRGRSLNQLELRFKQMGIPPIGGGQDIEINPVWDNKLKNLVGRIEAKALNPALQGRYRPQEDIAKLYDLAGVDPDQIKEAAERVGEFLQGTQRNEDGGKKDFDFEKFRSLSLQQSDTIALEKSPIKWLDDQFDILYNIAKSGELVDSPQVNSMQSKFGEAIGFLLDLQKREPDKVSHELIENIQRVFNARLALMFARVSIDRRSLEGIQGSVQRLGATGFMNALSFDNGNVGAMFNRMCELMDDTRIREGGMSNKNSDRELQHLSPEQINKLQDVLENEQIELAMNHAGVFADQYGSLLQEALQELNAEEYGNLSNDEKEKLAVVAAKDKLAQAIRRSVRTAFDVTGVIQRQAVIGARGMQLDKFPYSFFTDPKSIFDMFNVEELLTGKWGSLNEHQLHFLHELKMQLAEYDSGGKDITKLSEEEKEELGTRLLRDLFVVPDFFSSSWRIAGTVDKIRDLQIYHSQNEEIVKDMMRHGKAGGPLDGSKFLSQGVSQADQIAEKIVKVDAFIASQIQSRGIGENEEEIKKLREQIYGEFTRGGVKINGSREVLSLEDRKYYINKFGDAVTREVKKRALDNAQNLALFMRLRAPQPREFMGKEPEDKKDIWKKIQTYRPEEMMKLIRGRAGKLGKHEELEAINKVFESAGIGKIKETNIKGEQVETGGYDRFKRDYGPVLASIREKALRAVPPQPVNFRKLLPNQVLEIDKALGPGASEKVKKAYDEMDKYIAANNVIDQLLNSTDYSDIYTGKVLTVDDIILDQLERSYENSGDLPNNLSGYWAANERGGDSLVRNYNDLAAAQQATGSFVQFLKAHTKDAWAKAAEEFAHHVENYNGLGGAAKAFRFTYGSYLKIAEQYYGWDIMGVGNIGRFDTSRIEEIFGQGVDPLTREQILHELDHYQGILTGNDDDPEKYYQELMYLLGTDTFSRLRDKGFQVFIFTMLILMLAPVAGAVKAMGAASR